MAISDREAVASLKILVAIARADGILREEERLALESVLAEAKIPGVANVENLLEEDVDVDEQVKVLTSREAREQAYQSAYTLANADGECSPEEKQLLDRMREQLKISEQKASLTSRILSEAKDTVLPSNIQPISDPVKRSAEIKEDVLKYSVLSAILGAFPVPGVAIATDLAVVGIQIKMARDVGQYYGHKVDKAAAKSLLGALGLGTGARIAVSNLCKLIPGFGSIVGATTSFAATWALGKIADKYFAAGGKDDPSKYREEFKAAEKEGKEAYKQHKKEIDDRQKANKARIEALNKELKAGKITQEQYEQKVAELA